MASASSIAAEVLSNLATVRDRVAAAARRVPIPARKHEPRLVAVSKTKPAELMRVVYDAGQRVFGENYIQELIDKAPLLPSDIQWHFIGSIQSNKVKQLLSVPNIQVVETVDRLKIAQALNKGCESIGRPSLDIMVQVNTSGEESKSGCEPAECTPLVRQILSECPRLRFIGLMTIGRPNPGPGQEDFVKLVECQKEVCEQLSLPMENVELSMGMSNDFEEAIEHGSTNVRVGSSIFGHREYIGSRKPEEPSSSSSPVQ